MLNVRLNLDCLKNYPIAQAPKQEEPQREPVKWKINGSTLLPLAERNLKYFGAGVAFKIASGKAAQVFMETGLDGCPAMPKIVIDYAKVICHSQIKLPGPQDIYSFVMVKGPLSEELFFRYGFQELMLKKLPKALLHRWAPSYENVVDTKIAQTARVVLVAAAFACIHVVPPEFGWPSCSYANLAMLFGVGLAAGTIQEATGSPLLATAFHAGFNVQSAAILSQMGLKPSCFP